MTPEFQAMLRRLAARIPAPGTIIDLGASDGRWAAGAYAVWPSARLLLIDANPAHAPGWQALAAQQPRMAAQTVYQTAMIGGTPGTAKIAYNPTDAYQGLNAVEAGGDMRVTTIDTEVAAHALPGPYLIKFDIHGREHSVLAGARHTLGYTSALVIEVYTRSLGPESLCMVDLCKHIEKEHGLLPSDWCEPMRRPYDGRMHQVDMVFERKDAPGMNDPRYE